MNNIWFVAVVIAAVPIGLVIWWFIDRECAMYEEELDLARRFDDGPEPKEDRVKAAGLQ